MTDASNSAQPDDIVTLTRIGELPAAQLLRGRLEAEGIECFIPDEIVAAQTWHLNRAIGGIRVQVRRSDLERARQILDRPYVDDEQGGDTSAEAAGEHPGPNGVNDGVIGVGDRAAYRSMRVALASLWLMGLLHPYSLWLSVRALARQDVTPWGRRRAVIGLLVSLAGCAWFALIVAQLLRR